MEFVDTKRENFLLWIITLLISIVLTCTIYQNMFQLNGGNLIGNVIYFFSLIFCVFPIIFMITHYDAIKKLMITKLYIKDGKGIKFIFFLLANFLMVFMAYNGFVDEHFSSDSYSVALDGAYSTHMRNGRIVGGIISYLLENILNINMVECQQLTTFSHLVIIAFCVTYLLFLIYQNAEIGDDVNIVSLIMALGLLFVNVFYVEILLFVESNIIFSITILTSILSAGFSVKKMEKRLGLSFLLLFISVNLYQVSICYYILTVTFILLVKYKGRFEKDFVKEIVPCAIIAFFNTVINISISVLLQKEGLIGANERNATMSPEIVIDNIKKILFLQKNLWIDGYGLLPKYSCLLIGMVLIIFNAIIIIRRYRKKEISLIHIVLFYAVLAGLYMMTFAPHIISGVFWPAQRTMTPWFFFMGFLFVFNIVMIKNINDNRIILAILILFLSLNVYFGNQILGNNKIVNFLDRQIAYELKEKIEEYETNTGTIVRYIAFYEDKQPQYSYPNIKYLIYDTNLKASQITWSRLNCINYWLKSDFVEVDGDKELDNRYFKQKNWNYFNADEQIIFSGDIVNLGIE